MYVDWTEDQVVATVPDDLLAEGLLEIGIHFGIALEGRELVATILTEQLDEISAANPKWVYSQGFGTIYSYLPAGDPSSITSIRILHIPESTQSLKIAISKWRPQREFTLQEAICGVYIKKNREGINIYEGMARQNA